MPTRLFWAAMALAGYCLLLPEAPAAEAYSSIPASMSQIADPLFRDAMAQYEPNYDSLPRSRQVAAYVNMYKVLNNGQSPAMTPQESAYLYQPAPTPSRRGSRGTHRYEPWHDPSWDPFWDEVGILSGWGWGM